MYLDLEKEKDFFSTLTVLEYRTNLNKENERPVTSLLVFVVAVGSIVLVNTTAINNLAFAGQEESKFFESDLMIKDFGVSEDGNPFLTVEGIAGRTIPQNQNLNYAYVFVTDNGTYAVTSHGMHNKWHTHGITLDDNNCVMSINNNGGAEVKDMVKVTGTNTTKVDKVMSAEFTINNSDGLICASRIFDSAP